MAAEGGSGGGGGGGGGEETTSLSPKNRVKFLCSHGGKILPRPSDGHLKYVGGETRVVAVPRGINFSELMKRLTGLFDGDIVLKYQLNPEDLDALVSVRSDEDLRHMLDEYERHESEGTPRLRAFLFPANPIILENQMGSMDPRALEQRYIDAINGIIRATTANVRQTSINANRPSFSISSAGSSPTSLSPDTIDSVNHETIFLNGYQNSRVHMHKVQSSPSLCSLNNNHPNNNYTHQHHHHYYHNQQQHHHHIHHGYQSSKPPQDHHKGGGSERLVSALSMGRADIGRDQMGHGPSHYYLSSRHYRGSGGCTKCGHVDGGSAYRCRRLDRVDSLPQSPKKPVWE